jgi:peptide/nickel transport system permease protein
MQTEESVKRKNISTWRTVLGWATFLLRRLALVAAVSFAIVYFSVAGLHLGRNSTSRLERVTVIDVAVPALEQTIDLFEDIVEGDLGFVVSGVTQRVQVPRGEVVVSAYLESARLLVAAIGFAALLGVLAGGLAASWRHSPLALSTLTLTVIGVSIPSFFLALLLRVADIAFYRRTGMGLVPVFGADMDRTQSLLPMLTFPALVLAARPLAHITRVTFVSLSEIMHRDFIRTARSKGVHPTTVFWRHALRNVGVGVLTAVVVSLRFALGSLPVVEIFFDWPGLGATMLDAIRRGDARLVALLALSLGVTFLLVNMVLDVVYRWIDPRLRASVSGRDA